MQRVLSSRMPLGCRLWLLVVELSWALMDQGWILSSFMRTGGVPGRWAALDRLRGQLASARGSC